MVFALSAMTCAMFPSGRTAAGKQGEDSISDTLRQDADVLLPEARYLRRVLADSLWSDSLLVDSLLSDSLLSDSLLSDSTLRRRLVKQLTVDSVLRSVSQDSILSLLASRQVIEVLPDTMSRDTVKADTVRRSKSALDAPVDFSARDSITFDYTTDHAMLYGEGKVK